MLAASSGGDGGSVMAAAVLRGQQEKVSVSKRGKRQGDSCMRSNWTLAYWW